MLDKVYVRSHMAHGGEPLDVGALAETCLFYGATELVLGRGTLRHLLERYGADAVVAFVRGGYVRAHMLDLDVGVVTKDVGTPSERHDAVTFKLGSGSYEAQVVEQFRSATGRSGYGRRRAMSFLEAVHPITMADTWKSSVVAAFRDSTLVGQAITISARYALPDLDIGAVTAQAVTETTGGEFMLEMSPNWPRFQAAYASRHGEMPGQAQLLVHLTDMLTDLQLSSRLQGEISTTIFGAELLQLKCRELEEAASLNQTAVSEFQTYVLNGRDIRSPMNSGERSLSDLMALLDRSRKFRSWIADKPIDADLVGAYIEESTADTWASSLRGKTFRLAVLLGGPLLAGSAAGFAVGTALSVADMFVLERLAAGWRPNQFIDQELNPFVRPAADG